MVVAHSKKPNNQAPEPTATLVKELGPANAEKLRAARDEAYPPAQRIHDLAATKAILSRRVKALTEQRKLYDRIMSGPY
jgi:hypothetical protein